MRKVLALVVLFSLFAVSAWAGEGFIWTVDTVTMTLADTEYSYSVPVNAQSLDFIQCRENFDVRIADETGKVATSTNDYATLKAGSVWYSDNINLVWGEIIYFACSDAGKTVEIGYWKK